MRAVIRWSMLVIALLAAVGVAYVAYTLAGVSWDAVVNYRSPYVSAKLPEGQQASAAASRTVMVIIDGLGIEPSRDMGTLNNLRSYGSDLELTTPQPSLSYPNWTTLLSGAPPEVSGVVTNWHEGPAQAETIFDTAKRTGVRTVFVGPEDFEPLYGVKGKTAATYMKKWQSEYLTGEYVDAALRLVAEQNPRLVVMHLPDVDEAGHAYGAASEEYAAIVKRVDGDLGRLVNGLQDGSTVFVVVADHGHIATGGHGGWEDEVTTVPGVFSGPGVAITTGSADQVDVASSVAVLAGAGVPRLSYGKPVPGVLIAGDTRTAGVIAVQQRAFADMYADTVVASMPASDQAFVQEMRQAADLGPDELVAAVRDKRLAFDRTQRIAYGAAIVVVALAVIALIGVASWRALVAALAGTAGYYLFYNGLFFLLHGYRWSLSSFNSEDLIKGWMSMRLAEAAVAGLVGAAVAALVYPLLRRTPRGPSGIYRSGWLTLGPATALVAQATLALQVGWFVWAWGIFPEWRLPDLMWAFKYDLDLIQATALGAAALLAPLVTYLVGRYHPKVRAAHTEE